MPPFLLPAVRGMFLIRSMAVTARERRAAMAAMSRPDDYWSHSPRRTARRRQYLLVVSGSGGAAVANEALRTAPMPSRRQTISERVAGPVRDWSPFSFCLACLAATLDLPEHLVRAATPSVLEGPEYEIASHVCYTCRRMSDMLTFSGPRGGVE
jgi:hypothetical protein